MTDDQKREFDAQAKAARGPYATGSHSERIATERALMRVSNTSRSDVRASLRAGVVDFQRQLIRQPIANFRPSNPPQFEEPLVTVEDGGKFEPVPFGIGDERRAPAGGTDRALPVTPFEIFENGQFVIYNFNASPAEEA